MYASCPNSQGRSPLPDLFWVWFQVQFGEGDNSVGPNGETADDVLDGIDLSASGAIHSCYLNTGTGGEGASGTSENPSDFTAIPFVINMGKFTPPSVRLIPCRPYLVRSRHIKQLSSICPAKRIRQKPGLNERPTSQIKISLKV